MVCVWDFAIEFEWGLCFQISVANERVASHVQCAQRRTRAFFLVREAPLDGRPRAFFFVGKGLLDEVMRSA